jgi:hypothetical protein
MPEDFHQPKVIVFAGDTVQSCVLAAAFADAAGRIIFRPPAGLGDVWRYIRADVTAMVVIDCRFGNAPSLWHREIRSALEAGITMIGAGGIGALRAAEMNGMGMTGVGRVYERVQEGLLEADDEVLSGSDGFALVTLRLLLEQALRKDVITSEELSSLVKRVMACFHRDRTWQLVDHWLQNSLAPQRYRAVAEFFGNHALDPRGADALDAVGLGLSRIPGARSLPAVTDPVTDMMRPKWRLSEMYHRFFVVRGKEVPAAEVLAQADSLRDQWLPRLKNEYFVRRWMADHGLVPEQEFLQDYAEKAVAAQGDGLSAFLLENALTLAEFRALLAEAAAVVWADSRWEILPEGCRGKFRFADAWALDHGIDALADTEGAGCWVIEKGPAFFGLGGAPGGRPLCRSG